MIIIASISTCCYCNNTTVKVWELFCKDLPSGMGVEARFQRLIESSGTEGVREIKTYSKSRIKQEEQLAQTGGPKAFCGERPEGEVS